MPLPVEPAIKTCGILLISLTTGEPETSRPKETVSLLLLLFIESLLRIDLRVTREGARLGTSIPTRDLPGIGASILTVPVGEAKERARSFCKFLILAIFVP